MAVQQSLFREIVVDNFAGGGGASTGIEKAIGRSVDIAINHDQVAIAMHQTNHPETEHYCEDVWEVNPRKAVKGRLVALVWLSPDCTYHSKALGGKPRNKKIRGLAWVALRWAATVKPRVIILENVEEFAGWGPLLPNGKPDPKQRGREFKAFVNALMRQGYQVEWRELRACDHGAPTSRKRLFLIARRDGLPIVWPKPTHGDPNSPEVKLGILKPWRTAAEFLDFSLPCPSIFDTAEKIRIKYGIRAIRPLAENTMKRIAKGVQKFVFENPKPFIIRVNHSGSSHHYCNSIDQPFLTITSKNGWGIVAPFLAQYHSYDGEGVRGQALDRPIMTIDTNPRYSLVTSHLVKLKGTNIGQRTDDPIQTITAGGLHFGEVRAFLSSYYGAGVGSPLDKPLPTVVSKDRFGLVVVGGLGDQIADIGMRMLEPYELFAGQGFPDTYKFQHDYTGRRFSKAAQVDKCGNAVPPQFAEHLVRANLPELCAGEIAVGQ